MGEVIVEAHKLGKRYSGGFFGKPVDALRELDLSVERGKVYGLLGPNGAGKTTTIKILLGLTQPTMGVAKVFGVSVGDRNCRRRIGYLAENQAYPPYLTAEQVLDTFGGLAGIPAAERRRRIDPALAEVGIPEWRHHRVGTFSKGMKQRLGIALAFFHNPDLVILDEPTDGVDPEGRRTIMDTIRRKKAAGVTTLVNSHILREVEVIADEITILNKGTVIQQGSVSDLTAIPKEFELVLGVTEAQAKRLPALLKAGDQPGVFRFLADKDATLDEVVDGVRAAGATIRALTPLRKSLEDAFLDIVKHSGKA